MLVHEMLPDLLLAFLVAVLIFGGGGAKLGPVIRDLLRGGPRPPSHPLPGDDSV